MQVLPAPGKINADLKVGQNFSGLVFSYLPNRFVSFEVTGPDGTRPVTGIVGDTPAAAIPDAGPGLYILSYHSTADTLTFDDLQEFAEYAAYEGNDRIIAEHAALGLAETNFTEAYTRCAKALVQVGPFAGGADRAVGLPAELVALTSPYDPARGDTLDVQLLWQDAPLADQRINVFFKGDADGPVPVTTDADGQAGVDVSRPGTYLLNAVVMTPNAPGDEIAWESHWASLTFEILPRE